MNNPLPLRILLTAVIMIATTAGLLAFAFMKFPGNAVVIFLAVAVTVGTVYLIQRKEKAARFNIFYTTVQEFGKPLNFGNLDAAFERAGTRFDVQFPKDKHNQVFKVNFHIPNIRQKFSIQNRTLATRFDEDCQVLQDSSLPPDFLVQSRNPTFLLNFLKAREIRDEILNYKASFWGRILIALDDGDFELVWAPPIAEQIEGFYQVCQSAVVFHDELKRISELPR
jgi:hypothetical protein